MQRFWIAVNADRFSLCETPFEHVPRVTPKPAVMLGFPSLREAKDAEKTLKQAQSLDDVVFVLTLMSRHPSGVALILNPDYELPTREPQPWRWEPVE